MFSTNRIIGIIIFTVVEVVTLVLWLIFAGLSFNTPGSHPILAIVILTIGLFIEHLVSVNVAVGRALAADPDLGGVPRATPLK
jgi:hypothetical protein